MAFYLSFALIFSTSHSIAWANPSGARVVYGDAVFAEAGSTLQVEQGTAQLIIDWQQFSVGSGETTRFIQPGADSAVLNRVVGANLSEIHGQIQANGEVFLINPNGIVFGENAQIDTASFTASTLDVDNDDFLNGGSVTFTASGSLDGQIVNMGRLEAISGNITLISEVISNHGELRAHHGAVNLASGREVIVQPDQERPIFVRVPSDRASIDQSGLVEAARVEILAAHSNPFSLAINQSGIVRAVATQEIDGEIWLVGDSGTVEVSGEMDAPGGDVLITGSRVELADSAVVLAEGHGSDGGRVRIGGSQRGQDGSILHADRTFIDEGARVSVDARGSDVSAGTIVAWGNETLRMYGDLSARGTNGARGGFIETSAGWFDLGEAIPDVGSDSGLGGEWLIDPYNVRITDNGIDEFADTSNPFDNPNTDDAEIDVDTILTALNSGVGVTVTVETGAGGAQDGNITIETDIDYNGVGTGDTLWFKAANDVSLLSSVAISDTVGSDDNLNVVIQANSDGAGGGEILMNSGSSITTNGGEIILSGGNYTTLADLRDNGSAAIIEMDGASLSAGTGAITGRGQNTDGRGIRMINTSSITTTTGAITLYGEGGDTDFSRGVLMQNTSSITSDGGAVSVTGIGGSDNSGGNSGSHGIRLEGGSYMAVTGASTLFVSGTGSQELNDSNNDGVSLTGSAYLSVENGDMTVQGVAGYGSNSFGFYLRNGSDALSTGTGSISITGRSYEAQGVETTGTGPMIIGGASMSGDLLISAYSASGSDAIRLDSDSSIQTSGTITLQPDEVSPTIGIGDSATGDFNLTATELGVIADGASSIIIGRTDGTGAIDVEALTFTDDVLLQSLSGDINIDGALSVGANNLGIDTGGTVSQSAAITASGLALSGSGSKTLENAGNGIDTLALSGGAVSYVDQDGLTISNVTVNGTSTQGLAVSGDTTISAGADLIVNASTDTNGIGTGNTLWLQSTDDVILNDNGDIADSSGSDDSLSLILQSDSDGSGEGRVLLNTNLSIETNGGEILASGGNFASISDLRNSGFAQGGTNAGVDVYGASLNTGAGNITLRGQATDVDGVRLRLNSAIETTTGDITIYGEGVNPVNAMNGVTITGATTSITSAGGDLSITGIGNSDNTGRTLAHGIEIKEGATITLTGDSALMLNGTGSQQTNDATNIGVRFSSSSASVENGDMTITGTGGANFSIGFFNSDSTLASTGGGDISITGIAQGAQGIDLRDTAPVIGGSSMTGDITLEASTDSWTDAIVIGSTSSIQTSGTITLRSEDISHTIGLGDGATGQFNLDATELAKIADGAQEIIIGRSDGTGNIDIEALSFTDDVYLLSDTGNISIDGSLNLASNNLRLDTDGTVTQAAAITASGLTLSGTGASYTLTQSGNDIDTLIGNTGTVSIVDADGFSIDSFTATSLDAVSTGAMTNSGVITVSGNATFKTLNDSGADITLGNAGNTFGSITATSRNAADTLNSTGNIAITETGDVVIAAISTSGDFTLTADGNVSQTGGIQVDTFSAQGSGTYVLENSANTINTLGNVSRGGSFSLYDSTGGLDITGSFTGTLTNSVSIRTVGDLTLSSGASIVTSGRGNNITLEASGGSFINNAGSSALTTDSRFLIYSEDNESPHEKGGLSGEEVFEVSFGEDPQATGNVFYYAATDPTPEESVSEEPETVEDPAPETPETVEDTSPEEPESTDELPVEAPEDPVVEPAPQTAPDLDSNPSLENELELIEDTPITIASSVSRDISWVLPLGILPGAANESIGGVIPVRIIIELYGYMVLST
ncbi:MAG: filamentous hemagglutinin N-terminal domain-containing protein, partial [Opitutales bacterium]